ncbi:hypothetical protein [Actinocorallia populi]|uniref:hypothetical protein n=1 Tax=Actinocorallia populi TaxID=2079200 RepID=UPI000D090F2C|nr:hypothetical protein [Actinocorallia populi]
MGTMIKDTGIAASVLGAVDLRSCGDLDSALAYGVSALTGGGVVMSQRWRGLNETIMGGASAGMNAEFFAHPTQAPAVRRTVLAPYPESPPV